MCPVCRLVFDQLSVDYKKIFSVYEVIKRLICEMDFILRNYSKSYFVETIQKLKENFVEIEVSTD